jgi:hypothetical protein
VSPFDLTATEAAHVRAAARFLRARMGGWKNVGKALHASVATVQRSSPFLAFRVARLGEWRQDYLRG